MTGKERILSSLNGKPTDKMPTMLHCFMTAAREHGISMAEYRSNPEKMAQSHLNMVRKYGLDGILLDIDTCIEAHAIGVPVDFPEDEPARVNGSISQDIDLLIERIDPDLLKKDSRIQILLEAVHILKQRSNEEFLLRINADQGPFSIAMLAYGMNDFMMDLLDEDLSEKMLKLIGRCCSFHIEFHKLLKQAGADITSFGDSSCGPDLISRKCYKKFALPFHKRIKTELDLAGIQTICHICGKLDNIIEDVAEIGFSGVEIDYKTDISLAHKALENKSIIFGPLDPSGLFLFASPEEIALETKRILKMFNGKGIVIGAGCALPPNVPEENIFAFVNAVNEASISE